MLGRPRKGDVEFVAGEARRLIVPGFRSLDEVRAAVVELVEDTSEVTIGAAATTVVVDREWARALVGQRAWRGLSDADRVESAFVELGTSGIVARMNFTCCQSCGHAEIGAETAGIATAAGYVFFHSQDTDALADPPATLFLAYGAFAPEGGFPDRGAYEAAATQVGRCVVAALQAAGLQPVWDGSLGSRIRVPVPDWRRRLPS